MDNSAPSWEAMYADENYSWFWPPAYDPQGESAELAFIFSALDVQPGQRILDLAAGQGWLTIPLALRGCQVTGYDLSEQMLACARAAANRAGARITWVRGDMRHLPEDWSDSFDSVSFTLSEFGCFSEPAENQRVLEEVARVLRKNGRFLLDIIANRDSLIQCRDRRNCLEGNGFYVFEQGTFDTLSGIHRRAYRWFRDGQPYEAQWQIQTFTPPEVKRFLEQAGLRVLSAHGDLTGSELTPQSKGMTFLSQKI